MSEAMDPGQGDVVEAADKGNAEIGRPGIEAHNVTGNGIGGHGIAARYQQSGAYGGKGTEPGTFAALAAEDAVDQ